MKEPLFGGGVGVWSNHALVGLGFPCVDLHDVVEFFWPEVLQFKPDEILLFCFNVCSYKWVSFSLQIKQANKRLNNSKWKWYCWISIPCRHVSLRYFVSCICLLYTLCQVMDRWKSTCDFIPLDFKRKSRKIIWIIPKKKRDYLK